MRVWRNSGETHEMKTEGWFMDRCFPSVLPVLAIVVQEGMIKLFLASHCPLRLVFSPFINRRALPPGPSETSIKPDP